MASSPLIIYHGKCPDGFGAAVAAYLVHGDAAQYHPAAYDDTFVPDFAGRDVYVLDFCYPPQTMQEIADGAKSLTVLDHHLSAMRALEARPVRCTHCKPLFRFDMGKSGATLAWEHFHPGKPVPILFRYIEDRDLWRWRLEHSQEYLAALDYLPFEFKPWLQVLAMDEAQTANFIVRGKNMHERFQSLCDSVAEKARPLRFQGVEGLWVSGTSEIASDVGSRLAQACGTFGAVLHVRNEGSVKVSLRGSASFDVLPLAQALGGGGHAKAASFFLPIEKLAAFVSGQL